MIFWEQVKLLREAKKLSQTQLAKALYVSKQSVSNWENNNIVPSVELLVKLADFFGVTTDYLLGRSKQKYLEVTGLTDTELADVQRIIEHITKQR